MRVPCPTCKRENEWSADNAYRPFCSERCRLVDLGAWFTGGRSIPDDGSAPEGEPGSTGDQEPGLR